MKYLLLILFCFSFSIAFSQIIEDLKTNKQTAQFLSKYIDKKYTFKYVFNKEKEVDNEDFNEYVKKNDLDNNGFIDLVVDGYSSLILVLNNGNNNFKELKLNKILQYDFEPILDKIYKYQDDVVLVVKSEDYLNDTFKLDSLTFKYGQLVSYKRNKPKNLNQINQIKFSTNGCFGNCPIFEITIKSDYSFEYIGIKYTQVKGKKIGKISSTYYNELVGLLYYSDIMNLKDFYSVNWTDDQTGTLAIQFENEEIKQISDYGLRGNIDLKAIYNKLNDILNHIQ
ncbi:DUF6438 domain-containing protein [Moheibacter sp.]|uniref:DUF6438 domain-containing protein n=1 Tax=Moheibacter sp. TaxID=1965316 RepID=UPI003C73EC1D